MSLGGLSTGALASQFSAPVAVLIGAIVILSTVSWVMFKISEILKIDLNLQSKQTESFQ